jgi:CBS domain-containing protein
MHTAKYPVGKPAIFRCGEEIKGLCEGLQPCAAKASLRIDAARTGARKERRMRVGEVCNRDVVIMDRNKPISEAARLMRHHHVGDVVVVEERSGQRYPVGILTDRDLVVEVLANEVAPESLLVGDVMSFDLITTREEESLLEAIKRMRDKGIRRMPVIAANNTLIGIITMDDLLDLIAEQLADLVVLIGREQRRETDRQP